MPESVLNVRQRARETAIAVSRHVLTRIESGQLRPGDQLPTERELVGQFGGARGAIRKALGDLETEGWIGREVGRGTFVKRGNAGRGAAAFVSHALASLQTAARPASSGAMSISRLASPRDVMELRLMLEPLVIEQAVSRASAAEIDGMDNCLNEAQRSRTLEEFEHWDDMLHRAFADASRNALFVAIYAMVSEVRLAAEWGELKRRTLTKALKKKHFKEHVALVNAVRARDAAAARRLMQHHLEHIRQNMFGQDQG
jgi:GntR family transcriptional repressor for pyruvate dehydrogenase complex